MERKNSFILLMEGREHAESSFQQKRKTKVEFSVRQRQKQTAADIYIFQDIWNNPGWLSNKNSMT